MKLSYKTKYNLWFSAWIIPIFLFLLFISKPTLFEPFWLQDLYGGLSLLSGWLIYALKPDEPS